MYLFFVDKNLFFNLINVGKANIPKIIAFSFILIVCNVNLLFLKMPLLKFKANRKITYKLKLNLKLRYRLKIVI